MKAMDLLMGLGGVQDSLVAGAAEFRQGKRRVKRLRRAWLIAAIIVLTLLLAGCAVVYALRLQDMAIREEIVTQEAWSGPSGEYVPPTEWVSTQLSLQGYNGSPEQMALREWLNFKGQYDPDGILLKENNRNESGVLEQYFITYDCYTLEMMEKLNEILEKYSLKPLGAWLYFDRWETQLFYQALQIDSLCQSGINAGEMAGYFSPEGSFKAEFHHKLEQEQEARIVTYVYAKKQYFYPYYSVIQNLELWRQWHYTTAEGADVLLATYENALLIICDSEDGFIHISTENKPLNPPYDNSAEAMTKEKAEKIADSFHYSIHPQPCDPAEVEAMRADYPEPEKQKDFMVGFRCRMENPDLWYPPEGIDDSFEHYISYILETGEAIGNRAPDQLDYCFVDLNQDGQQEILLRYRDTGEYREIIQMTDDPDSQGQRVSIRYFSYLYEGPIFERIADYTKGEGFIFYEYKDFSLNNIACLRYDSEAKTWAQSSTDGNTSDAVWEAISESEVKAIRASYTPLSFDMKPLGQFPMGNESRGA